MWWILRLAPLLMAFWLVLSGHFTLLLIGLGVLSIGLVAWIVQRMGIPEPRGLPPHLVLRLPRYLLWLAGQVQLSALAVLRQVWSPRIDLRPAVGVTSVHDLPELAQVIYANSITLTPGTLSLSVDDEGIEVHSLQESGITELQAGEMARRVRQLEVAAR